MPNCFTCGKDITFDKSIVSKTGKQIPLWPDKENTHSHDEAGNPIRGSLPQIQQQQRPSPQGQQYVKSLQEQQQPSSGQSSSGGSYMDTKRLRVMTEELQKQANLLDEKLEACYQLDKSNNAMLGELIQFFKINDPKSAKELYEVMQHTKQDALKPEPEVRGWNSDPKDFPVEKTLKDDDEGVSDDL